MDKLIERELLAAEAERLGFVVTDDEVEDQIARRQDHRRSGAPQSVPRFRRTASSTTTPSRRSSSSSCGMTPNAFIEEQKKELLAARVRDLLRAGVDRVAGRGEGGLHPQEPPGEPRVHALHRPPLRGRGGADGRRDRRLRRQERGEAEGDLRAEEVRLREGAARSASSAKSWSRCRTTPTPKADKAARDKAERAGREAEARAPRPPARTGSPSPRWRSSRRTTPRPRRAAATSAGARAARPTCPGDAEEKVCAAKDGAIVGPLKGSDGYVITKVEGSREGNISVREGASWSWPRRSCARSGPTPRPRPPPRRRSPRRRQSPTETLKTIFPPAASDTDEASRRRGRRRAARRGDRAVLAARARREGADRRGHRRLERARQGGLRADGGGAARRPVRGGRQRSSWSGSRSARTRTWRSSRSTRSSWRARPSWRSGSAC